MVKVNPVVCFSGVNLMDHSSLKHAAKVRDCCPGALQPASYINSEFSRKIKMTLNALVFTQHILCWFNSALKRKKTHLSKMPMWVKKDHTTLTALSLSWAEMADFCWSSVLGDISGILGQAWYVLSPRPPYSTPGPAACWPTLRTPPSVLPPVVKLANEAAQVALPWFGRSARGLKKEGGDCGAREGGSLVFQRATP